MVVFEFKHVLKLWLKAEVHYTGVGNAEEGPAPSTQKIIVVTFGKCDIKSKYRNRMLQLE